MVYALFIFIAMLVVVIVFLPKLLRRKAADLRLKNETDMIAESFSMLGNEMKSLREQLILFLPHAIRGFTVFSCCRSVL